MEETISLKEIFDVIKKRFWMIVSFVVGAALIAAVASYFLLTPKYESTSQFIVNQGKTEEENQYSVNDIKSNVEIINTYNVIITSNAILAKVVDDLNLSYDTGTLEDKIDVSSEEDSQVVNVTVTDTDPDMAADIANSIVGTFKEDIPEILDVDNVSILTEATVKPDQSPVSPHPKLNIAIAIVLGGMVGVGLAFLLEYMDNTIRTEEDVEKKLGLPVFGSISHIDADDVRPDQYQFGTSNTQINRGGGLNDSEKKTI